MLEEFLIRQISNLGNLIKPLVDCLIAFNWWLMYILGVHIYAIIVVTLTVVFAMYLLEKIGKCFACDHKNDYGW